MVLATPMLACAGSAIPHGYEDYAAAPDAVDPAEQAANAPDLAGFLDPRGHLVLPPGFTGSLDPSGYRLVSGKDEPLRFVSDAARVGHSKGGEWAGFGGLGDGCNGLLTRIAVGSPGEVYVAGRFTLCGDTPANRVARFNTTTQTWSSLGSGTANGINEQPNALLVSGNHVYVGGFFTQAGGVAANRVARFDTTTQTWTSLGSGTNNAVRALALEGQNLFVGGDFTTAGGESANRLARFDTSTQTWSSLGSGAANGANGSVNALVVSSGDVYAGGSFTEAGGVVANRVARFETTTQTWGSLGAGVSNGVNNFVVGLAVSDGQVFVGGGFTQAGGLLASRVARFDLATQSWASLGMGAANGVSFTVEALAISGTEVYAGGTFVQAGGATANNVARFNTTTQQWDSLGSGDTNGVTGAVTALAVSGSRVIVGGLFTRAGGAAANYVAQFDRSAQTWATLGSGVARGVNGVVHALVVSGSGVYVGGDFTRAGGVTANYVARFDTITQTWDSLGSGAANGVNNRVNVLALSGNVLYLGGDFLEAGGNTANRVARFDTTVQTWDSLGIGATNGVNSTVLALAVSGSQVYVGGRFTLAGVAAANRVARFDTTTQSWFSLGNGTANGVNNTVQALAIFGSFGSDVIVGGEFTQAGGATALRVARFDSSTQSWTGLGTGLNSFVLALAVSGSQIFVGGGFNMAGGTPASLVARFDTTTQTWSSLGSGVTSGSNLLVRSLALAGSELHVGGFFTQAGGAPANNVARFDTTAQSWSSLGSGPANGVGGTVNALAAASPGTLYVGGNFGSAGGAPSSSIARFVPSPLRISAVPATVLVGNASVVSVSGGFGSGAITIELTAGAGICSLVSSTLTALAAGECVVTATKAADGTFPEQTDSVLVRTVSTVGVNLVVEFSALPPGAAPGLLSFAGRGACPASAYRISVRNNGPLDAAEVRLQMPAPRGLLPPVSWLCVLGNGQCTPQSGQAAVDTRFAMLVGAQAEIDLSACPDPNAAFADFQFQASLPGGNLLFPTEAQGNVSTPLNGEGLFRDGFE